MSRVVAPVAGERVLDLCAAPGAKTTHLAALMRGKGALVAVERHPGRAAALRANCRRMGAPSVDVRAEDAEDAAAGELFDRVLLDAPCSDLGTLQARPDARWRRTPEDTRRLAALQRRLLGSAAERVRPGGTLVYSVCTISPDENEGVVEDLLAHRADLAAEDLGAEYPELASPADRRFLRILPHRHGTDGFFLARLRRLESP